MSSLEDTLIGQENAGEQSEVAHMFHGRSVFMTGASGFVGRVLLEKLLRCYPGIQRIYILLRTKKNESPVERLYKRLLNVAMFDKVRKMKSPDGSDVLDKIVVIAGDISEPQLGMSDPDVQMMIDDPTLSIVFHVAATIKFDEQLKVSVQLNLIATKTLLDFCRKLSNLISLCHVSTAYANADQWHGEIIEETVYPMRETPNQVIQLAGSLDENLMQLLKPNLVADRPNTYTYTKALTEHLIMSEASDLPVAIVRPSIVGASWQEPLPGWVDNLNGPTGLFLAIGKGLLRSVRVLKSGIADIIPVDIVANTIIAAAYYVAVHNKKIIGDIPDISTGDNIPLDKQNSTNEHIKSETTTSLQDDATGSKLDSRRAPIFHCTSGDSNPHTWGDVSEQLLPIIRKYPSNNIMRYPDVITNSNQYAELFIRLFVHYFPAVIIDMLCMLLGKKRQLMTTYHKIHNAMAQILHFSSHNYNFKSNNLRSLKNCLNKYDQQELYMNIQDVKWNDYYVDYVLGIRRYLLREGDDMLEEARRRSRRTHLLEMFIKALMTMVILVVAWSYVRHTKTFGSIIGAVRLLKPVQV